MIYDHRHNLGLGMRFATMCTHYLSHAAAAMRAAHTFLSYAFNWPLNIPSANISRRPVVFPSPTRRRRQPVFIYCPGPLLRVYIYRLDPSRGVCRVVHVRIASELAPAAVSAMVLYP